MPVYESFVNFFANLSPRSHRSQRGQGRSAVQPAQPQTPPRYRLGRATFDLEDNPPEATAAQSTGVTGHSEVCIDICAFPPTFTFRPIFLYDLSCLQLEDLLFGLIWP